MATKKPLNLDFDDVAKPDKKKTKKKTAKKPEKKENTLSGIILTIPAGDKKFLQKDLVECTAEEFLEWAAFCYPDTKRVTAADFETISARKRAFKQALQYHLGLMTPDERNAKH